jgi:hypothetical protein
LFEKWDAPYEGEVENKVGEASRDVSFLPPFKEEIA